jgi:hypothetical protein
VGATLYDSGLDPVSRSRTKVVRDSETGLPLIVRTHNSQPIIDANKRQAASFTGTPRHGVTHVARIPRAVYARLVRMGITRDEKAFNAWLNERDNRVFRVDDARKL